MLEQIEQAVRGGRTPGRTSVHVRFVRERSEQVRVRQDVVQPVTGGENSGAMITVQAGGGMGYAARHPTLRLVVCAWRQSKRSPGLGKPTGAAWWTTPRSRRYVRAASTGRRFESRGSRCR